MTRVAAGRLAEPAAQAVKHTICVKALPLLERDVVRRPEALVRFTPKLIARMMAATIGVEADPKALIVGEVAL